MSLYDEDALMLLRPKDAWRNAIQTGVSTLGAAL